MIGKWPKQSDSLKPYDPQRIFKTATEFIERQKDTAASGQVLESIRDMAKRGVVDDSARAALAESACLLSGSHFKLALAVIEESGTVPQPDRVRDLVRGTNPADSQQLRGLEGCFSTMAKACSSEELQAITLELCNSSSGNGTPTIDDVYLGLWIRSMGDAGGTVLLWLLTKAEVNECVRGLVWRQAVRHKEQLGKEFFLAALPALCGIQNSPKLQESVCGSRTDIEQMFQDKGARYDLAKAVLNSLRRSDSLTAKNILADWLKNLNGGEVLRELGSDELDQNDREILSQRFSRSRYLKT